MSGARPLLIGEVTVDFTLPTPTNGPKMRLGGVVHAARGLWASGLAYSVGAFCPAYLVDQARDYLTLHGCQEFLLLGEITGAPNVIIIGDVQEIGHQGYEDILRDEKRILPARESPNLTPYDPVVIFPGRYDLRGVLDKLNARSRLTIDIAYDVDDIASLGSFSGRFNSIVISTSSSLFMKIASTDLSPLLDLVTSIGAQFLLLKENRGGSRLFDLRSGDVERIPAWLGVTENSVGVGDVFTALFGTLNASAREAAWRGMQAATVYSRTTWPDDLRRDVDRELRVPIDVIRGLGGVSLPWHARPSLPLYLAAPDFSYANHAEIKTAVEALEYHNFHVRRPIKENGEAERDTSIVSLAPYYSADVRLLRDCAAVFAIPIERDPGTLVEVGLAIQMGKPVITFDPRGENRNTMVVVGSSTYSSDLDICLNGVFDALSKLQRESGT